jgi:hypothetical protein
MFLIILMFLVLPFYQDRFFDLGQIYVQEYKIIGELASITPHASASIIGKTLAHV